MEDTLRIRKLIAAGFLCVEGCFRAYVLYHSWPLDDPTGDALVLLFLFLPQLLLALLIVEFFLPAVSAGLALVVVLTEISAINEGVHGESSTSGIALAVHPAFVFFVVIPVGVAINWGLVRFRRWAVQKSLGSGKGEP